MNLRGGQSGNSITATTTARVPARYRWAASLLGLVAALLAVGCNGEPQAEQLTLVPAGSDFYVGDGVNVVFGFLSEESQPVAVNDVQVRIIELTATGPGGVIASVPAIRSAPGTEDESVHIHADGAGHTHGGEDEGRGVYYAQVDFPFAGVWGLEATGVLADGTKVIGGLPITVREESAVVKPGEQAFPSVNLTRDDVDDIVLIDSGEVPNDLHDVRIAGALSAGRPFVVAFATPGFCQTQFCGPVVQEVESLHDDYAESVDFVHIEVWLDRLNNELNPTVKEWIVGPDGSLTEPWVFVVDRNGRIFDRWEGPAARNIIEPAIRAVAGGAVYGEIGPQQPRTSALAPD